MGGGADNVCFSRCGRSNSDGMFCTVIIHVKCFIIEGTPLFIGEGRDSEYDGYDIFHPWLILSTQIIFVLSYKSQVSICFVWK